MSLLSETPNPAGAALAGANATGKEYWRSLDQLAETPEFKSFVEREFPAHASEMLSPFTRRTFLNLMAASVALAGGLTGCRRPEQKILPYSKAPENLVPGIPQYYATAIERNGSVAGVIARCFEGRPVKLEGNVDFPSNLGALDAMQQALILELYDPDRSQHILNRGKQATLEAFAQAVSGIIGEAKTKQGAGLAVLSERTTSPTLLAFRDQLLAQYPQLTWHVWEPINDDQQAAGTALAFGQPVLPRHDFTKANVVVAFDGDFLTLGGEQLLNLKQFAKRRRPDGEHGGMNRLYAIESMFTLTGGMADHRLRLASDRQPAFLQALASRLNVGIAAPKAEFSETETKWLDALAKDIQANSGSTAIVVGQEQVAAAHALAAALNQRFGANCVAFHPIADPARANVTQSLSGLVDAIGQGRVNTLVILGGNPVYDAPADFKFGEALGKVAHTIHLSLYANETTAQAEWHLPRAHQLESWGDVRAVDGTIGLIQPLISPLFGGLSDAELLSLLFEPVARKSYEIVTAHYRGADSEEAFLPRWRRALHDGLIAGSSAPVSVSANIGAIANQLPAASPALGKSDLALQFLPDPRVYDGRYANNGWLQETPHPVTKLTWDNAALISKKTADELGVKMEDVVKVEAHGQSIDLPVVVLPGIADYVVAVQLGHGRTAAGRIGNGVGSNVYPLRTSQQPWFARGVKVSRTSRTFHLANVQDHWSMEDRPLVLEGNIDEYEKNPKGIIAPAYFDKLDPIARHDPHGEAHGHDAAAHEIDAGHAAESGSHDSHGKPSAATRPFVAATTPMIGQAAPENPKAVAPIFSTEGSAGSDPAIQKLNISPFKEHSYAEGHQWGMTIDLSACTGCQACMVACQAENNIPIVGKAQVRNGREMQWIRLDRYFVSEKGSNDPDAAQMVVQPMGCQQCENAPCEQVCPVAATTHSPDGINEMTYNRCIGTRYCSNNCPFKVRRFNFFNYHEGEMYDGGQPELVKMASNPNVTVRMRGVMEKCTFCVQRVRRATQDAKVAGRVIKDGDIKSACQETCPADAIVFGDINDAASMVSLAKKRDRTYELLSFLNIKPRVSYLARLRNPNPELMA